MKRTIFDALLVIALVAAGALGWLRYQAGAGAAAQAAEVAPQAAAAVTKLSDTEKQLESIQADLEPCVRRPGSCWFIVRPWPTARCCAT